MKRWRAIAKYCKTPRAGAAWIKAVRLATVYNLTQEGKLTEGIALLKVAVDLYPKSTDAYDLVPAL